MERERPGQKERREGLPRPPDDGLSFHCELCMDAEGGCPQCGHGEDKIKAEMEKK